MKNGQIALFAGYWVQKTAQPARLRPPFLYLTPLFPRKYAAIALYSSFAKSRRKKSRQAVGFGAQTRSATLFFRKNI